VERQHADKAFMASNSHIDRTDRGKGNAYLEDLIADQFWPGVRR
jgi:hypothetical protein